MSSTDLQIITSEDNNYSSKIVKVKSCLVEIITFNNLNYRLFSRSNQWKKTCCYSQEECYNFTVGNTSYCKKHQGGVFIPIESNTAIGDKAEKFIYSLLIQSDKLINVKIVGNENGKLDITYQLKDELDRNLYIIRGLQIKTLIKDNYAKNSYKCLIEQYDEDTLIVAIDKEFKYICIVFKKLLTNKNNIYVNFNKNNEISQYVYRVDENLFFDYLIECCKISTIYDQTQFSADNLKEKIMVEFLKTQCSKDNLDFRPNDTSDSSIDCFIHNKSVQCKYASTIHRNLYSFSIHHTINGTVSLPYSEDDQIDFFIFSYCNNYWWVIPTSVLIHYGYIKTCKQEGKIGINLCYHDNQNEHWTKQFIVHDLKTIFNPFDMTQLFNENDMFDKFQFICKTKSIECIRNMENLNLKNFYIRDKLIKYSESNTKIHQCYKFNLQMSKDISYNKDTDIIPDFFVFRIGLVEYKDHFYIIPKEIFIEHKIIGSNDTKGCTQINIPPPGKVNRNKPWLSNYLNNYEPLYESI